jgi:hypothetical protein
VRLSSFIVPDLCSRDARPLCRLVDCNRSTNDSARLGNPLQDDAPADRHKSGDDLRRHQGTSHARAARFSARRRRRVYPAQVPLARRQAFLPEPAGLRRRRVLYRAPCLTLFVCSDMSSPPLEPVADDVQNAVLVGLLNRRQVTAGEYREGISHRAEV